jgi:hypothetical protein
VTRKDPIERAKERFREVQEVMAEAARVRQEYYDLEAFLTQAHHLFPDAFDVWPLPGMAGTSTTPHLEVRVSEGLELKDAVTMRRTEDWKTPDYAAWVLRVHGSMHTRDLVRTMRSEGWSGNADDRIAEKTVYNVLSNHPDRFRNRGSSVWEGLG